MDLSDVRNIKVPKSKKHRVGRGQGSGWGTTSGRGHKGAGQRSGNRIRLRFEGGQMPLFRRLPKKGFSNARFKVSYYAVNVGDHALFTALLEEVLAAGDVLPEARLSNTMARRKAARYLDHIEFYFSDLSE